MGVQCNILKLCVKYHYVIVKVYVKVIHMCGINTSTEPGLTLTENNTEPMKQTQHRE